MAAALFLAPVHANPPIPSTPREYRAAWCATVTNIDWPAAVGTTAGTVTAQKNQLITHLDAMVAARMNAMYLQVRPACDAFYASSKEPWSQWLTGSQSADATYDPLTFAVSEAHNRGIELHAWVNPYRAAFNHSTWDKGSKHVMKVRPDLCVAHTDGKTYLDPGKDDTITWITDVIGEIVSNYDVDGVVFDDYFYPGPDFDDNATYQQYVNATGSGALSLDDWRRDNVDRLIQASYNKVHSIRQSCQFEVGPFGIWRPGYPPDVSGSDYYATHYCDTRKWLQNGWVDSLSPQLYWPTDSPGQPFGSLINWWAQQNPNRHVLASTAPYQIGGANSYNNVWINKTSDELLSQIDLTRQAGAVGNVHYSMHWITDNHKSIHTAMKNGPYAQDALRPTTPWLDNIAPPSPVASIGTAQGNPAMRTISFSQNPGDETAKWWTVKTYDGSQWNVKVLPGNSTSYQIADPILEYAVSAVDRSGNESLPSGNTSVSNWSIY